MKVEQVKINKLHPNTGQINGLPKNPRFIRDEKFEKLKKSIEEDAEMMEMRQVIAYDNNGELVVICGNMRLRACRDLGFKEIPAIILPIETPVDKLKRYTIKDNAEFGQNDFDLLANEWNSEELDAWGVELPIEQTDLDLDEFFNEEENNGDDSLKISISVPAELSDAMDEIKSAIKEVVRGYDGVKVL